MDYNFLLEESADAIIATTPAGDVTFWNKGAEAMFGYTRQEAIGHSLDELIVPADRIEEEKRILHEASVNHVATYESLRRRKDGSLIYVDITSKSVRNAQGNIEFILSNKKDVTHLKVLRDAKLIEAKYRDLLESTPDAIVMLNVTGRVVLANSQAEKVFGYQRQELLGQPVEVLLPERFRSGHVRHRSSYFSQPR